MSNDIINNNDIKEVAKAKGYRGQRGRALLAKVFSGQYKIAKKWKFMLKRKVNG